LGALIRDSTTRSRLLSPNHEFYTPEFALEEVRKYAGLISSKSGLAADEINRLLNTLATNLKIVPLEDFTENIALAEEALKNIDETDVPFLALAMNIKCDGIWSNDKHMKEQKLVNVWNTTEVVSLLD